MHYVKHFDILGVDTKQIACIELQGVPTAATEGAVGVLGVDMTSGTYEVYICTAVNGSIYTWQCLKDGKDGTCVAKAEINSLGELLIILSDGKEINVGVVKGEQGVPGVDGKDGENGVDGKDGENGVDGQDGVSVVKAELNAAYELIFTLSNDTIINVGVVRGEKGEIPPNCVYTDNNQTITGEKTFSNNVKVKNLYTIDDKLIAQHVPPNMGNVGSLHYGDDSVGLYFHGENARPQYYDGSDYKEMALLNDFADRVVEKHIIVDQETGNYTGGYILFASGILMQWGTTVGTGGERTIFYPKAFATSSSYALLVTPHQKESGYVVEYNRFGDTKYYHAFLFAAKAETKVDWFAIGRREGN